MPPKKKAADKKSKPAAPMSPLVPTGGEIDESSTKERRTGGVAVVGAISARLAPAPALATPAAGGRRAPAAPRCRASPCHSGIFHCRQKTG